ncbi:MAG TPA: DUF308 domain-containing protein [Bacilli bacterium]|nr:DUF308 domain-containing protein [Bacilli bacterium]
MKYKNLISPIFLLVLGIILLIIPGAVLTLVIQIVGVLLVVTSLFYLIDVFRNNSPSLGLVYATSIGVLGVLLFIFPETIASLMPLILGLWIIIKSMFRLQLISTLKIDGSKVWFKVFIVNLLMLIMGIVLVFNPFKGAELMVRIIAIFILAYALLDIIDFILTNTKLIKPKYKKKPKKVKVIK